MKNGVEKEEQVVKKEVDKIDRLSEKRVVKEVEEPVMLAEKTIVSNEIKVAEKRKVDTGAMKKASGKSESKAINEVAQAGDEGVINIKEPEEVLDLSSARMVEESSEKEIDDSERGEKIYRLSLLVKQQDTFYQNEKSSDMGLEDVSVKSKKSVSRAEALSSDVNVSESALDIEAKLIDMVLAAGGTIEESRGNIFIALIPSDKYVKLLEGIALFGELKKDFSLIENDANTDLLKLEIKIIIDK